MLLSVIVTIVDGGSTLTGCLEAILNQERSPPLEVLVPYDDSVAGIAEVATRFPQCRFVSMGPVRTHAASTSFLGQHELIDRRRSAGLAAASGDLVAIVEDRGVPRARWAASAVALHAEYPHAVIGGAVENGRDRTLNWSVYFCDFGRYQLPFPPRPSPRASDVNVCYKRAVLDSLRLLWADRYHEPIVHEALLRRGETIFLSPDLVVDQMRDGLQLGALCRERVAWARLYAAIRIREVSLLQRATLVVLSPLLPLVLMFRLVRDRIVKRRSLIAFLVALPCTVLLLAAWSVGEATAYLFGMRPAAGVGDGRS